MKNQRKKKRILFISSVALTSILALIFVIMNFRDNIVFFYSPSELQSTEIRQKILHKNVRIGGLVEENSVKKIDAMSSEFVVTDYENAVKIIYHGLMPDLFREGQGVVAKGKYDAQKNEFLASELLIKHDEKYVAPEIKKSLKRSN